MSPMTPISLRPLVLVLALSSVISARASAQTTQGSNVHVAVDATVEENKKQIRATVTVEGKPLANATVVFSIKRTFGNMTLGQDKTLDDGTAEVAFPSDLPGGGNGQLDVIATLSDPPQYAGMGGRAILPGAKAMATEISANLAYPRALWAPRAPLLLIVTIFAILGIVWCVYGYVVVQLLKIWQRR